MKSLIDQHFPLKRKRIRRQTHPWLDSTTLKLMRTRDQMHKKAKRSGLSQDWNEYRRLRNKVTEINRKARKDYFRNKLEENRGKPKAFWDTLRLVLPSKKNCNEIERLVVDGEELSDKRDIANSLNEYFTTIAPSLLASHQSHEYLAAPQQENDPVISNNTFKFCVLNEDNVFNVLQTMDISISVLPCISKAQEMFANLDLQEFAAENNLIGDHQFAYARNSSTTAALIITVDSRKFAIDKGEKVVCTFLDLTKAFDIIIDHDILISKLSKSGVTGNELKWFTSYLHERKQFVSCEGVESQRRLITHGVPQGSVLGPTLFNIHINGIADACKDSEAALYADDTEIHASS